MQAGSHAAIWNKLTLLMHIPYSYIPVGDLVRLIETEKEITCALDQETSMCGVLDRSAPQMGFSAFLDHGPNVCGFMHTHTRPRIIAVQTPLSLKISPPAASYPRLRLQDSRRFSKGLCFAASHVKHYRLREGRGASGGRHFGRWGRE